MRPTSQTTLPTPWLDTLLSSPVYYEQVAGVYALAMQKSPGTWTLERQRSYSVHKDYREGPIKFVEINRWVTVRHEQLIVKAIELAISDSKSQTYHFKDHSDKKDVCGKLKELLDILLVFGQPSGAVFDDVFSRLIDRALMPTGESGAKTMLELLRAENTAAIIKAHSSPDAMVSLRRNLIDKDSWKFPILASIDEFLDVDYSDSMMEWGDDCVSYAENLVEDMPQDSGYEDYTAAIEELQSISSTLGVDFWNEITALEAAREQIPHPEDERDDYEDYARSSEKTSSRSTGSFHKLDEIFGSLLE